MVGAENSLNFVILLLLINNFTVPLLLIESES